MLRNGRLLIPLNAPIVCSMSAGRPIGMDATLFECFFICLRNSARFSLLLTFYHSLFLNYSTEPIAQALCNLPLEPQMARICIMSSNCSTLLVLIHLLELLQEHYISLMTYITSFILLCCAPESLKLLPPPSAEKQKHVLNLKYYAMKW